VQYQPFITHSIPPETVTHGIPAEPHKRDCHRRPRDVRRAGHRERPVVLEGGGNRLQYVERLHAQLERAVAIAIPRARHAPDGAGPPACQAAEYAGT